MKIPTDKVLHFILALILAILASIVIANAIYDLMPNNPSARTATAYGAAVSKAEWTAINELGDMGAFKTVK